MVYICVVCQHKYGEDRTVSFHKFPVDEILRKVWMTSLKLTEQDLPKRPLRVCSKHFLDTDFIWTFGKLSLRRGATPFRSIKERIVLAVTPERKLLESKQRLQLGNDPPSVESVHKQQSFENQPGPSTSHPEDFSQKELYLPRDFEDCQESMLMNPRLSKHVWSIASRTVSQQKKIIKCLHSSNRRLILKAKSLNDLINHLKESNGISENCFPILQECGEEQEVRNATEMPEKKRQRFEHESDSIHEITKQDPTQK